MAGSCHQLGAGRARLSTMAPPLSLRFVTSAATLDDLPDSRAEVAIVGRSNVGKSSLINAIANSRKLALVSKTPGRTQLLNCFSLTDDAFVVDCPGYGYAAVSKTARQSWQERLEDYLQQREQLAMIVVLVDGEVGPTKLDVAFLRWLRERGLPHQIVATKHDKVRSAKREKRKQDLVEGCEVQRSEVLWASATTGIGVDELRQRIPAWLGVSR